MVCTCWVANDPAQSIPLIVALNRNARDLLSDAQVLLQNGRQARAFVLSVLAREEAGKALMVLAKEMGDPDVQSAQLRNHKEKLLSANVAELFLGGELTQLVSAAQDLRNDKTHEAKMAGLYVDIVEGELRTPDCINPEQAAKAFADATLLLGYLDPILGQLTAEALMAAEVLDHELGPVLDEFVETAGVEAGVELARRLMALGVSQTAAPMQPTGGGLPDESVPQPARRSAASSD